MSDSITILVVILSVTLVIFLLMAIVLAIYLIKLARQINEIAKDAGETSRAVNTAMRGIINVISPVMVAKQVKSFINKFNRSKKGKDDVEE